MDLSGLVHPGIPKYTPGYMSYMGYTGCASEPPLSQPPDSGGPGPLRSSCVLLDRSPSNASRPEAFFPLSVYFTGEHFQSDCEPAKTLQLSPRFLVDSSGKSGLTVQPVTTQTQSWGSTMEGGKYVSRGWPGLTVAPNNPSEALCEEHGNQGGRLFD